MRLDCVKRKGVENNDVERRASRGRRNDEFSLDAYSSTVFFSTL